MEVIVKEKAVQDGKERNVITMVCVTRPKNVCAYLMGGMEMPATYLTALGHRIAIIMVTTLTFKHFNL